MIHVSDHAADRYRERVGKSHLGIGEAKVELKRLIGFAGEPQVDCPADSEYSEADAYLEIAPGIWLALQARGGEKWAAVTCLVASSLSDEKRAAVNKRKADRRAAKRTRNRKARNRPENHRPDLRHRERWLVSTAHGGHRKALSDPASVQRRPP